MHTSTPTLTTDGDTDADADADGDTDADENASSGTDDHATTDTDATTDPEGIAARAQRKASANPTLAFEDLIQRDPTVCNNCFQRTHDAITLDKWSGVHGWYTVEFWDARRDRTDRAHHHRMTFGLTRSCTCGMVDGGKRRPLTFSQTCEYAENLIDTLREKGIPIDADVLRDEVRAHKRDPDLQYHEDSRVFAPAVTAAIRAADTDTDTDTDRGGP